MQVCPVVVISRLSTVVRAFVLVSVMEQNTSADLARLWTEAQPVVAAYIASIIPNFHQSEDVLQQVAVVLVRQFEDFDRSKPFLPWALGIARITALKSRREVARRDKYLLSEPVLDMIEAAFCEQEESLVAIRRWLRSCLEKQPEKVVELLRWRYGHDLKPTEVAPRMGITAGAVRAMLHRARDVLRKCLRRESRGRLEWK